MKSCIETLSFLETSERFNIICRFLVKLSSFTFKAPVKPTNVPNLLNLIYPTNGLNLIIVKIRPYYFQISKPSDFEKLLTLNC